MVYWVQVCKVGRKTYNVGEFLSLNHEYNKIELIYIYMFKYEERDIVDDKDGKLLDGR